MTILLICNIVFIKRNGLEHVLDFYRKENGECPVEQFIDSLNMKLQAKVLRAMSMLRACGNTLREPYSKPLRDGIFELRTSFGSDTVRLLYFFSDGCLVVLTNGFVKKTQKTSQSEIETALSYKADWIRRKK